MVKISRTALAGAAAFAVLLGGTGPAVAAPAKTQSGARIQVIATGLDNPRGIVVAGNGTVLVAEAGRGGPGPCAPGAQGLEFCYGETGAVTAISRGKQRRVATGLPSFGTGTPVATEVFGPHDIALTSSGALVTIGLGTDPAVRTQLGPAARLLGRIVKLDRHRARSFADLARYEARFDPDSDQPASGPDSNPYGMLPARGGGVFVTDAGGNTLLRVDKRGRISTVAVFGVRPTPGPGGAVIPMHFVPTTVARGPDGALYVGQLTGFPFPVGGARVWRVVPGRAPTVYADGFTNIIDIAFDKRGRLLVLQIAKNGLLSGDPTGALYRVERNGTRTEIASTGLFTPTSVAVGRDGDLYVSNRGTLVGSGEVLRIRPPR